MTRRSASFSGTLVCFALLFAPALAVAQPGIWQTEEQFLREAGSDWEPVAPGVWQRDRPDGTFTRVGFGPVSFEWALDQARERLARLRAEAPDQPEHPSFDRRIRKLQELVFYLERSLEEAPSSGGPEGPGLAAKASESDDVCAGHYTLEVAFTCSSSAQVESTASWSEPGPLAPYQKTLHTYAEASWYDVDFNQQRTNTDEDSFGPFSSNCCVQVSSSAFADDLITANLYGSAYVSVTDGCDAFRFIEDSGDCR